MLPELQLYFLFDCIVIKFLISFFCYLLNVRVLESGNLLVLQIQEHPKEAISSADTVGER